jgi:sulfotransferase
MKLVTMSGLPRAGTTLLANVLNQHPDITVEMDSSLSMLITGISGHSVKVFEDSPRTMKELKVLYTSFMRSGMSGWISKICDTPVYLDKDRGWAVDFDLLFNIVPSAKVIFPIRDLRGVISSFEKLETKDRITPPSTEELFSFESRDDYHGIDLMEHKVKSYMEGDMIYTPLFALKEYLDSKRSYLDNFYFVRYEDFIEQPLDILSKLYSFIGIDNFDNNLNNIEQAPFRDAHFYPWGDHTINKTLKPKKETYRFPLIKEETQEFILREYSWYYEKFYPELL